MLVLWSWTRGACTSCHTSIYISDTLICTEKGLYETLIVPTYGLHRFVVICSLCHSKCTWLFRTVRIIYTFNTRQVFALVVRALLPLSFGCPKDQAASHAGDWFEDFSPFFCIRVVVVTVDMVDHARQLSLHRMDVTVQRTRNCVSRVGCECEYSVLVSAEWRACRVRIVWLIVTITLISSAGLFVEVENGYNRLCILSLMYRMARCIQPCRIPWNNL